MVTGGFILVSCPKVYLWTPLYILVSQIQSIGKIPLQIPTFVDEHKQLHKEDGTDFPLAQTPDSDRSGLSRDGIGDNFDHVAPIVSAPINWT